MITETIAATELTDKVKKYLSNLLRDEFDKLSDAEILYGADEKIINTAKELGLNQLAEGMEIDSKGVVRYNEIFK